MAASASATRPRRSQAGQIPRHPTLPQSHPPCDCPPPAHPIVWPGPAGVYGSRGELLHTRGPEGSASGRASRREGGRADPHLPPLRLIHHCHPLRHLARPQAAPIHSGYHQWTGAARRQSSAVGQRLGRFLCPDWLLERRSRESAGGGAKAGFLELQAGPFSRGQSLRGSPCHSRCTWGENIRQSCDSSALGGADLLASEFARGGPGSHPLFARGGPRSQSRSPQEQGTRHCTRIGSSKAAGGCIIAEWTNSAGFWMN